MRKEIIRLTFLFATFVLAYCLRFLYQIGLMLDLYSSIIKDEIVRWKLIFFLPLLWDISSIISILVLHYQSFRQNCPQEVKGNRDILP